jgi:imidazolonepropionase-like amidohydrolase
MSGLLVLRAEGLFDGLGHHTSAESEVVIDGSRIVAAGPVGDRTAAPQDTILEFPGAIIMPGLIDCHVHLSGLHCGGLGDWPESRDAAVAFDTVAVARGLERLLREGVTTVRDCGYPHHGLHGLRHAQRAGLFTGPRLVICGRAITTTGGHGASLSVQADGVDQVRQAVREEMRVGADWIKLMLTGGTASPHERVEDVQMTVEEARAAVTEAHSRGRMVAAHCSNRDGAHLALDAGVDSIEHGINLDDTAVDRMTARGTWLSAAVRCTRVEAEATEESGIPGYVRQKAAGIIDSQAASFRRALQRGVNIAAATDAGPAYFPLGVESMIAELATMQELGMTTLETLSSATGRAGQLLGLEDVGVIRPGAVADVIVVAGDPFGSLDALRRLELVIAGGSIVTASSRP